MALKQYLLIKWAIRSLSIAFGCISICLLLLWLSAIAVADIGLTERWESMQVILVCGIVATCSSARVVASGVVRTWMGIVMWAGTAGVIGLAMLYSENIHVLGTGVWILIAASLLMPVCSHLVSMLDSYLYLKCKGLCCSCGYELAGLRHSRCPECGVSYANEHK